MSQNKVNKGARAMKLCKHRKRKCNRCWAKYFSGMPKELEKRCSLLKSDYTVKWRI